MRSILTILALSAAWPAKVACEPVPGSWRLCRTSVLVLGKLWNRDGLQAAVPPRCPARPLSGEVRPLEPRMSAFPRFWRLHRQQQTWRPSGFKGRT